MESSLRDPGDDQRAEPGQLGSDQKGEGNTAASPNSQAPLLEFQNEKAEVTGVANVDPVTNQHSQKQTKNKVHKEYLKYYLTSVNGKDE